MAPLGTYSGLSYTGTGRGDAFSILSTDRFELAQAKRFLAHEYMHRWVAEGLGGTPEEDAARDYWFSEGFDDFLASRVLFRAGLWRPQDWVDDLNTTLLRYASSSARNADAREVAKRFWTDADVQQVSYDRGHLLALLIDARIRAASGDARSLDTLLRRQRKNVRAGSGTAASRFKKYLAESLAFRLEPYIVQGRTIALPRDLLKGCATIGTVRVARFDRGFDSDATEAAGGIIHGVDPDGPAFAAGMRDGMRLLKREFGVYGDSRVDVGYRVQDGTTERLIGYKPAGKSRFETQQVQLVPGANSRSCERGLAGL